MRFISLFIFFVTVSHSIAAETSLYQRWEQTFTATKETPSTTELRVEFTSPEGKTTTVPGFWNGGKTWRVRFMPSAMGTWKYTTKSTPPVDGLQDQRGSFVVTKSDGDNDFDRHGPLRIGDSKTHLAHRDGTPFFFLADTCWTGPALSSPSDWTDYLADRKLKGFTSIQYNALSPWRAAATDAEGRLPYVLEPEFAINPEYFNRLDTKIDAINDGGMLATHVMVWANKKGDAGIELKPEQLEKLLKYQVARYGAHHIFWILVGDNKYAPESADQWKKLGRAVFADPSFDSRAHVVTTHPTGMNWPWQDWDDEKWLNVLSYQSGHGDGDKTWQWINTGPPAEYGKQKNPTRPVINLEPPYEEHVAYQSKKPHDDLSVRRAMIWSLLNAPTAGVTYGGHGVWSWHTKPGEAPTDHPGSGKARVWREALDLPAATKLAKVRAFFQFLPTGAPMPFTELRPAAELLVSQPGEKDPAAWVSVSATPDKKIIVVYAPKGRFELNLPPISKTTWLLSDVRVEKQEAGEVEHIIQPDQKLLKSDSDEETLILLMTRYEK